MKKKAKCLLVGTLSPQSPVDRIKSIFCNGNSTKKRQGLSNVVVHVWVRFLLLACNIPSQFKTPCLAFIHKMNLTVFIPDDKWIKPTYHILSNQICQHRQGCNKKSGTTNTQQNSSTICSLELAFVKKPHPYTVEISRNRICIYTQTYRTKFLTR